MATCACAGSGSFAAFDRRARAGEALNVVFFGGSLSWGANASDPQRTSYRGLTMAYLQQHYPHASLAFHDAAIGGTGSQLGLFRLERDVLARQPDLVFLDFTVNDGLDGSDLPPLVSYETLLHGLIERHVPVVQAVFGLRQHFGKAYNPDGVPRRRDHLKLAAAYHTAVGDVYPLIQAEIEAGRETFERLWPFDGTHPDDPGYRLFFEAVRRGFEAAIADNRVCSTPQAPLFGIYGQRTRQCLADGELPAGWSRATTYRTSMWFDGLSSRWMDAVAACSEAQPLTVPFEGTLVGLFGETDEHGLGFRVRIDGQPLLCHPHPKEPASEIWPWDTKHLGSGRLFVWRVLASTLPPGRHLLEITPVAATNGQFRIESVCSAGE